MSGFAVPIYTAFYNGQVAAGGSINVYQTGTTTPITCYSNATLTTPISNPITLDVNGSANFYVSGTVSLRIDSYTATGVFIETVDPIYPVGATTGTAVLYQGTNLTLATTNAGNNIIATTAINIALPLSTTFTSSFQCQVNAQGGAITFTCNSPDKIQQGSAGASYTLAQGLSAELWCDGAGNWGFNFLGVSVPAISTAIPQGRLTLTTNVPVITSDVTAAGTIYYTPYNGQYCPIWNGTSFIAVNLGGQLTLTLNSTNHPTTKVYDIYVSLQSGVATLSAMYWGSNTSRSNSAGGKTGTGNATITQKNGIWVNAAAISASDSFNSTTGYAISINQGTYLGTFYTTGAAQTGVALKPTAANGGTANIIGLWNAYNRIKVVAQCRDNTSSWSYTTTSWRQADNNASNQISWVDGLQQTPIKVIYEVTAHNVCQIGVAFNSTSTPTISSAINATEQNLVASDTSYPLLGFNYTAALEYGGSAGGFYGVDPTSSVQTMELLLETEY